MADRRIRLFPTGQAYIAGIRAVERLVPPDIADRLLAFTPPAFTTTRSEGQTEPSPDVIEDLQDIESHPEFRSPEPPPAAPEPDLTEEEPTDA